MAHADPYVAIPDAERLADTEKVRVNEARSKNGLTLYAKHVVPVARNRRNFAWEFVQDASGP